MKKICTRCNNEFIPTNGNQIYCPEECYDLSKAVRQKENRDPIKRFIAILMKNHQKLEWLYLNRYRMLSYLELSIFGVDISLSRQIEPPLGCSSKIVFDFGEYSLTPDLNFKTFKLTKNDSTTI